MSDINIKELLSKMTLEEKVGQLVQLNAECFGESRAEITGPLAHVGVPADKLCYVGSALNFFGAEEMITIQREHLQNDRHKIPMIFMMDVIHGYRTIFPVPLGIGASFDTEVASECARMMAKEASAGGVQVTFAPMVDYVRDARWGRVMETTGEDPLLNCRMGAAQVKALQGDLDSVDNIVACTKHFAGYGAGEGGRDYNMVELSERLLREYYLPAYKACIDAGARFLMPSFNALNGVPSIANRRLMRDLLCDEWGFDGIIISDYNAIGELLRQGIARDVKSAAEMAYNCGCDIEMMSSAYCNYMRELIDEGKVSEADVDASVEKILNLKKELGLFDDPYRGASPEKEAALCLCPEHRDIARRAVEASAILLKNDGVLPLSEDIKKIALIGPFADNHSINGFWACDGKDSDTVTVYEGVRALLPDAEILIAKGCEATFNNTDTSGFDEAVRIAREADAVVLCLGEPQHYSGEANCRASLELPGMQNELAEAVMAVNKNTAAITFAGRPIVLSRLHRTVPSIMHMWFPGTEGGNAAANLLFGRANPSAKVPMSFPKSTGQCPLHYTYTNTGRPKRLDADDTPQAYSSSYLDCGNLALYPFGHGLSYTHFTYESLELDKIELTTDGKLTAKVTLINDGGREGKEVVQLYVRDMVASAVRPVQQLIGFEKVTLAAGERKTVEFTVDEPMLRFWGNDGKFISEAGEFKLSTGHADNLLFTKSFWLK